MKHTIAYNLTEFSKEVYLPSANIVSLDTAQTLSFIQKKAYQEKTYRTEVVLKIKIENFYLQKQLRS